MRYNQHPDLSQRRVRGGCLSIWLYGGLVGIPVLTLVTILGGEPGTGLTVIFNAIAFLCYLAIWNWQKGGVYGLLGLACVRVLLDLIAIGQVPYADTLWFDIVWGILTTIVMLYVTRPLFEGSPYYAQPVPAEPPPKRLPAGCPPDCSGADLEGFDLSGDNLSHADLHKTNLQGAILKWADLLGANLQEANLQGAILQGAKLVGANLQGANLARAILRDAILRGADLLEANLEGASLEGAKYNQDTKWPANFDPKQAGAVFQD